MNSPDNYSLFMILAAPGILMLLGSWIAWHFSRRSNRHKRREHYTLVHDESTCPMWHLGLKHDGFTKCPRCDKDLK